MSTPTTPRAIAARVYQLFDDGDIAGLDQVLSADLIDHNPVPGATSGIEGMRMLVAAVRDGFTDTRHELIYQGEPGDGWVVSHWRMTATHTGDWFGTSATGRPVSFTGTDLMHVTDGKITEIRHVEELFQLHHQLTT
ncbi:ester cyclase [Streptomyces sp. H27-C3]|uniref:ester cyclase n=1 Tax=Streptomyces sp. H27-C3 TaxID=3046305 RepID=UPI0024BB16EC|nr:ester cyclase [Streptomyces sp. H27-C3]MDJ0466895.1 ester cyclase [Streptomyces sp. H27-C3]